MRGIIIYKGKYGATHQYALWLGEELRLPVLSADELSADKLRLYDFVVLAGSVYVGKWMLRDWLKRNLSILQNKKAFYLIVCGTPASRKAEQEKIAKANIPTSTYIPSDIFFLPGRLIFDKLSWTDRFVLKMGARLARDPETKRAMLQDYDAVSRGNLNEIISAVKSFEYRRYGSSRTWLHQLVGEPK